MPVIERVRISDVRPWVDEYGNEFLSRDYSTKENQAYVERLADSMRAKGVPDEMVHLSRDGRIYRIVSGNSRVRAMRLLGTEEFDAVILDDEEASEAVRRAVEVTVRTNTKKTYDPVEESRFVQQLSMFRDDEYVAQAAGIEKEKVARVRRARKAVGTGGDGYTLERMAAIAEFEGDEEAIRELEACDERSIRWTSERLRRKREIMDANDELADRIRERYEEWIFLGYGKDELAKKRLVYRGHVDGEEDLGEFSEYEVDAQVVPCYSGGFDVYSEPRTSDSEERAREASLKLAREQRRRADEEELDEVRADVRGWVAGKLENFTPRAIPHVYGAALEYHGKELERDAVLRAVFEESDASFTVGTHGIAKWLRRELPTRDYSHVGIYSYLGTTAATEAAHEVTAWRAQDFVEFIDTLKADGYVPGDAVARWYDDATEEVSEQ